MTSKSDCTGAGELRSELERLRREHEALLAEHAQGIGAAARVFQNSTRLIRMLTVLGESGSIADVLDCAVSTVSELFDADIVVLLRAVGEGELEVLAASGLGEGPAAAAHWRADHDGAHTVFTARRPSRLEASDARASIPAEVAALGVHNAAWLPVPAGNSEAALVLMRSQGEQLNESEMQTLGAVSHRIGLTIEQALHTRLIDQLARLGHRVSGQLELPDILAEAVRALCPVVDANAAAVVLMGENGEVVLPTQYGLPPSTDAEWPEQINQLSAWSAVKHGKPYLTVDLHSDTNVDYAVPPHWQTRSMLAVPLRKNGEVMGLLYAIRFTRRPFGEIEADLASLLATHVSSAIDNARLFEAIQANERRLQERAHHDELTGLANRRLLFERLQAALAEHGTERRPTLLFLDLDRFKQINDSLGHEAGDTLLVQIAERLRDRLRPTDLLARLGGDEFVVLLERSPGGLAATEVAARLLDALDAPFEIAGRPLTVSVSIGIAEARDGETDPAGLLRDADRALYQAKGAGRARYQVLDETCAEPSANRLELEAGLRAAITSNQLRLVYQPIYRLEDRMIAGFEALVRWDHPMRGLLSPASFLPVAEDAGLIGPLGCWVLDTAAAQLDAWRSEFGVDLQMSVNASPGQLRSPDFTAKLEAIMATSSYRPGSLLLEITEGSRLDPELACGGLIDRLRTRGLYVAVDDFGSGYSSLSYLRRLPVDVIKVDRGLIDGVDEDPAAHAILAAILELGRAVGAAIVAEGIETPGQLAVLDELACPFGQGFFLARPLTPDAAARLVATASSGCRLLPQG